jgi:Flp pilus assembly protein TadG
MTSHISKDEVNLLDPGENRKSEHGQIFTLLAILIPMLIVFAGFGIDLGLAYDTKTTLSKAVDAAALAAMKNINLGTGSLPNCSLTSGAGTIGLETFDLNYPASLGTVPTPSICFSLDSSNNTIVTVSATATINTFFLRALSILPGVTTNYNSLSVGASATAQRNPLIMALVTDISYSMENNGGDNALGPAVEAFLDNFNPGSTPTEPNNSDTIDYVSLVTFGTSASVNVPMSSPFQSKIDDAVDASPLSGFWAGGVINYTNSQAGLLDGQTQIADQDALVTSGENVVKVLVFFTDGWPNIQEDTLTCPAATKGGATTTKKLYYCGCDPGDESLGLCTASQGKFFDPATCNTGSNTNDSCSAPTSGCGSSSNIAQLPQNFPDQQTDSTEPLVFTTGDTSNFNIEYCGGTTPASGVSLSSDAMYRTVQVSTNPTTGLLSQGVYVYAIGMGSAITGQPAAEEFLREVANDPNASTYNASLPVGAAEFAPCDTAAECPTDVENAFAIIWSKIALRLTK